MKNNVLYLKNYERKIFDIKYDSIFKGVFGKVENERFTKRLLELPKIEGKEIDMEDELVQWLVYINGKDRRLVNMALAKNKMLQEVDREVQYLQGEEAERRMQQLRDKWDFTMKCCIRDARAEGEKRGRKAGNIEKLTEIVKRMLELNIDKDKIMQITGIEKYDLEKIISKKI